MRTILSDATTPDDANPFSLPSGIFIDTANNQALVADQLQMSVIAVDLGTGARTILTDNQTRVGSELLVPIDIDAGFAAGEVLVLDENVRALFSIPVDDGDRTIVSR